MARGQTQYYGLSQWEAADKVERVDFNSDNARVDGALRALAEQAGQKADRSAVDSLSNVVEQKADKTALSAAEGRISDLESGKADKTELAAQIRALIWAASSVLSAFPLSRSEMRPSAAERAVLSAFCSTTLDRLSTADLSAFWPACSARARSAPSTLALSELKSTRSTLSAASHWESP